MDEAGPGLLGRLLRHRSPWWLVAAPGLALAIGLGGGIWATRNDASLAAPSRSASVRELERGVAAEVHQNVIARCQLPVTRGWTCALRSTDGRYGFASGTLTGTKHSVPGFRGDYSFVTTNDRYSWGFYVGPDGVAQINAHPTGATGEPDSGGYVEILAFVAASDAARSVGAKVPSETEFRCPGLTVGATVTCTRGTGPSTRVHRTSAGGYVIVLSQPLPGSPGYVRDPSVPLPPAPPTR